MVFVSTWRAGALAALTAAFVCTAAITGAAYPLYSSGFHNGLTYGTTEPIYEGQVIQFGDPLQAIPSLDSNWGISFGDNSFVSSVPKGGSTYHVYDTAGFFRAATFSGPNLFFWGVNILPNPLQGYVGGAPSNPDPGETLPSSCIEFPEACGLPSLPAPKAETPSGGKRYVPKQCTDPLTGQPMRCPPRGSPGIIGLNGDFGTDSNIYLSSSAGEDFIYQTAPGSPNFASITLPGNATSEFTLHLFNGAADSTFRAGQTIVFSGLGVNAFELINDPPGYVLGITFATTDPTTIGPIYETIYGGAITTDPTSVPEPPSLGLLASALVGFWVVLRRKFAEAGLKPG